MSALTVAIAATSSSIPVRTASVCAHSSSYASVSGNPRRSTVISAIYLSADSSKGCFVPASVAFRLIRLVLSLDHRKVIVPENQTMDAMIERTQAIHCIAKPRDPRVRQARTQNYVRSGYDVVAPALHIARRCSDHDEIVAAFHTSKITAYPLRHRRIGSRRPLRSAWQNVQHAVTADNGRHNRFAPVRRSGDYACESRIGRNSEDVRDGGCHRIHVYQQRAPSFICSCCRDICRYCRDNGRIVSRHRDIRHVRFCRCEMQVQPAITLRYDVDQRRSGHVCLSSASLRNELRRLDHAQHAHARHLLRFPRISYARLPQLEHERSSKPKCEGENEGRGQHGQGWRAYVRQITGSR